MNVSTKRASIGLASTLVAAGLVVGGVVSTSDAATSARPATTAATVTKTVNISNMMFMPATMTIKAGSKVKWVNHDGTVHTVTWNSTKYGLPSKTLGPGATFTVTFPKAGTFLYHCTRHFGMAGKVVVTK